jgi:Concanavalin A-like lectin/glucanases superfamily/Secretion system C-terminal sorting domain/NHL repeat
MKTRLLLLIIFIGCFANAQTISTMAGSTAGYLEGTGTAAKFDRPYGIAYNGDVVVTDQSNYRVRKIFSDNSTAFVVGSTVGFVNGTGAAAKFGTVSGVAIDGFNNTYVSDANYHCIRKITSSGVVTTFAGGALGTADGTGLAAQFNAPYGLAIDASGNLYVSDTNNHRIRKITPSGVVTTLAGSTQGYADGTGIAAQFNFPYGIAVDASNNVYVGENCRVRKITPAGVVTTFAGGTEGYLDGIGTAARFNNGIQGIAIDNSGNLFVADTYNYRIRKITPAANVTTFAGTGGFGSVDGDVSVATFSEITGIAYDKIHNRIYVADNRNNRIRKILLPQAPTVTYGLLTKTATSITLEYSINANNSPTTSVVRYGLTTPLTNQVTGFSSTGNTVTSSSVTITGLTPGTTYFFDIQTTNNGGTITSTLQNVKTDKLPLLIGEYKFNNSLFNEANDSNFTTPVATTTIYSNDRFSNPNSALEINFSRLYFDNIPNLPNGSDPRTISIWIKPNSVNNDNIIFTYGSSSGNFAYGASFNATNVYNYSFTTNLAFANPTTANTWKHIVVTYDASKVAKIYVNGVLGSQGTYASWNTATGAFCLGNSFTTTTGAFNGAVDDLKIYNYALTATEVSNLHNATTLASSDFSKNNLKVALYPNPVNDVLNIETASEIKSVEIYNLLGQKVKTATTRQVSVFDLQAGTYLVRVQDINNAVETMKIVKQ